MLDCRLVIINMQIQLNKIASVTKNADIPQTVDLSEKIISKEGAIIAVEVLEDKSIYNELELCSGRMSTIQKGDILAVALGNRSALQGFVGEVPEKLEVGDVINVLNIGGVAGICISENYKEVGSALRVKVLGAILKDGKCASTTDFRLFDPKKKLESKSRLIIVSGTSMNVGKTTVSSVLIKHATAHDLSICATKLSGVACLRDTEKMEDYGATKAVSFIDAGYTSTAQAGGLAVDIAKGAIEFLSERNPDYIVIEFGDGVFGEYGVLEVLKDREIQELIVGHIGCAHDPMGASKLYEVCKEIGAPLDMISGPVTDNSVGINFIEKHLGVPACNAIANGEGLFEKLGL